MVCLRSASTFRLGFGSCTEVIVVFGMLVEIKLSFDFLTCFVILDNSSEDVSNLLSLRGAHDKRCNVTIESI